MNQELIKNLCDLVWTQRGITGTFPLPCSLFWSGDAAHHILSTLIARQHLLKTLPSCTSHWGKHFLLNATLAHPCRRCVTIPSSCLQVVEQRFFVVLHSLFCMSMNYTCYDECREQSNVVPMWKPWDMCTGVLCFILSFFLRGGGVQFIFEKSNREKKSVVARCKTEENHWERPLRKIKEPRRGGRENRRWRHEAFSRSSEHSFCPTAGRDAQSSRDQRQ